MKNIYLILLIISLTGCAPKSLSSIPYTATVFMVAPHIAHAADGYYLEYQLDSTKNYMGSRRMLLHQVIKGEACYYFAGTVSFKEYTGLVRKQLPDVLIPFAENRQVYWLNPDGSRQVLMVAE